MNNLNNKQSCIKIIIKLIINNHNVNNNSK